ncbi:MAG: DUF1800 domain-containing protein [Planctomycetota bacterium]
MSWSRWQPSKAQPWDHRRITHLWRRAGFAPDWGMIQNGLREGFEPTLERVLHPDSSTVEAFEELSQTIGEAAVGAESADRLRAWWIFRMIVTPYPLQERMTLLWHNHFATSNDKVNDIAAMYEQNQLLREHSLGPFGPLLHAVIKHPAMLKWLDAESNRKAHPNENLARELLELFTLGEGHYSERDVTEAARCLTGWTVHSRKFLFHQETHDAGSKHLLGATGRFNGDQLLDLLLLKPSTAWRIAWRLCRMFFGENVLDEPEIDSLAELLIHNQLNVGLAVETILRSERFYADENIGCRVASPAEYMIGTVRALELGNRPPSTLLLAERFHEQGQDLFHPPTVFGWEEGRQWINTRTILARQAFAHDLVGGALYQARRPFDTALLPARHGFETAGQFYSRLFSRVRPRSTHDGASAETLVRLICDTENQLV